MRFDLTDLRLFLEICEAGSITAGAERANMALASASERVRGMELDAGAKLLERGRRGVAPTLAGLALVHHARAILDQSERLRAELSAFGRGLKGHVRLMANTSALSEHLPRPLAAFLAANPNVDLDVEEALSREIVEAVASARVEFGVLSDGVETGDLVLTPFRKDDLVVVTPRDHALAGRRSVGFAEILDFDHIGLTADAALQDYLAGEARRLGKIIRLRARMRGFDGVCRLVEQGVGIGVIPLAAAERARRSHAIRLTRLSDRWAARRLVIATRRGADLTPHAQALVDCLLAAGEAGPT